MIILNGIFGIYKYEIGNKMKISPKSVSRLFRYRYALKRLRAFDISWIYSEQIASSLGVTAAQVRKDFSFVGLTGKRKSGYQVGALIDSLNKILEKNTRNAAIIAGFGPLGKAVYNEFFLYDSDIEIVAAFDGDLADDGKVDDDTGLMMFPMASMVDFIRERQIRYGIITASGKAGQQLLDRMVLAGVKGIVSLSSMELKSPKSCVVQSVNPLRAMENVVYFTERRRKSKASAHYEKSVN
jgi:redox-sensing transcriptional repressor